MNTNENESLKALRKRLALTQKQLAEKLGYSRAYIGLVETGKRPLNKHLKEQLEKGAI